MQIDPLLLRLSKPAQRALLTAGITRLEQFQDLTEKELLELHGIGKAGISTIKFMLSEYGILLKDSNNTENG